MPRAAGPVAAGAIFLARANSPQASRDLSANTELVSHPPSHLPRGCPGRFAGQMNRLKMLRSA